MKGCQLEVGRCSHGRADCDRMSRKMVDDWRSGGVHTGAHMGDELECLWARNMYFLPLIKNRKEENNNTSIK